MKKQISLVERGIIESLPQIPYIIDQVGEAIKWVKEVNSESRALRLLQDAQKVAEYTNKVSNPNFFKTQLILAFLLHQIPDVLESPNFSRFDNPSKNVENAIKAIRANKELGEARGCFNAISMQVTQLASKDEDLLCVFLIGILGDLKETIKGMKEAGVNAPITPQDYIMFLGYAYVMANLRMANLNLLNTTRDIVNEINIILNNEIIY